MSAISASMLQRTKKWVFVNYKVPYLPSSLKRNSWTEPYYSLQEIFSEASTAFTTIFAQTLHRFTYHLKFDFFPLLKQPASRQASTVTADRINSGILYENINAS